MNRTDQLTDRLIDGSLTDAEASELHGLLAAEPDASARHLGLLRLELALRDLRTEFDLADSTAAHIEAERIERTTTAVMAKLAHRPRPAWQQPPTRRLRIGAAAVLAASLVLGVWVGLSPRQPTEPPAVFDLARLTAVSGSVEVVGPDGVAVAHLPRGLTPDQTLRTVGEDSAALLEFPDRSRVEIHPESAVRVVAHEDGETARKVVLVQGRVIATAAGRPLVVGTGATEVEARRGSFSLWASGTGSARVEATDEAVRVVRGGPAEPLVLSPGGAAFVRDERSPVRIESPLRVRFTPRDRLDFMALDVGFTADGIVWAVSAKQRVRWRPNGPLPDLVRFRPHVFNDGLAAWLTPDRRAVALCRVDGREERISIHSLPSGEEQGAVSVRISEARFLAVGPDASWIATTGGPRPDNRRVRVWDVMTGQVRFAHDFPAMVTCQAASPDGRWLAAGISDLGKDAGNFVSLLDPATGERAFDLPTRRKAVTALAFTANASQLAAGFNGMVQLWDVSQRRLVGTLEGFERVVTRLAFDPMGTLLAAGTQDGQVWVWSMATGQRVQVIQTGTRGVRSLAFSADGKSLVTATNKAPVAVWDIEPDPGSVLDSQS